MRLLFLIIPGIFLLACFLYMQSINNGKSPIPHFRLGIGPLRFDELTHLNQKNRTLLLGYVTTFIMLAVIASSIVGIVAVRAFGAEGSAVVTVLGMLAQLIVSMLLLLPLLKTAQKIKETMDHK